MRPDQVPAVLVKIRHRIRQLDDEAAQHRCMGRSLLAERLDQERRQKEIEAGYITLALEDADTKRTTT